MKRSEGRGGTAQEPGSLGRILPMLLPALLIAALAVPAGAALSPGFLGPPAPPEPVAAGPWQQVPETLSSAGAAGHPAALQPLTGTAPMPGAAVLAAKLTATLKADGAGSFSGVVQDAVTGKVLFDRSGDELRAPASNIKLLTAAAALRTLGPETRFSTRVVAGPAPGSVVLTGGGDVLLGAGDSEPNAVLGHAGLATLARSTARALQQAGATTKVKVLLDDSLFSGPALNPAWSPEDVAAGEVAPLFPLALNSARYDPDVTAGPRPRDAALTAAQAFADRLSAAGVTVAAGVNRAPALPTPSPAPAKPDTESGGASGWQAGAVLAEVQSATVGQQVDLMLRTSDNYLAEVLGRMVAAAEGKPASNDGAVAAVLQQLEELKVPAATLRAADLAGLTLANKVSARQLSAVVRAMTSGPDTRLRSALAGFPVAGLTGTLDSRYTDSSTAGGAGLVRAKTGTLNTVIALSGYVVDADGRLLVFSFIGNGLTPGAAGNKVALDRAASILAGCGCR
ncbi:D-alanyl-D-alanine carboxypeptidase/D-alanyl-D-alanine-endopeptidase [Arthrobacter sp. Soil763]|uniref:D-alanyl-D-alanine carboxypeptidase/D-alanyl-D-alanine endopeptidase n=1 Tax=Arthrobacter sp. Soil763 TaxID=1736402 RepID=UPI0006F97736|nr:D-alanyl-D-alanine carboxypeptidase/D-alanyl-D-alanine-endopeptidase [Arthrobacter sp. Soil763]KRE81870.1 D-alanyl-D-alanine carboxypeptidase [Arthrobacter sp. Soil763]